MSAGASPVATELVCRIDDEILETFAIVGEPDQIAGRITARWGDCVDRMTFYSVSRHLNLEFWAPIVSELSSN